MKKIILILGGLALMGAGVGLYMYNKPHEKMESAKAEKSIDAKNLYAEYEKDETAADAAFLGKVLEVSGVVREVHKGEAKENYIVLETDGLMGGVKCQLDHLTDHQSLDQIEISQNITIKGYCSGYLMDVIMDRCVILKK